MSKERTFTRIDAAAAQQLYQRQPLLVLDSRDQARFDLARLPSAQRLTAEIQDRFLTCVPRDTPVLIYCYHGNASQIHAQTFADFGFTEVYSLDGGFAAWQRQQSVPPLLTPRLAQWLADHGYPADNLETVAAYGMTPLMRAAKSGETAVTFDLIQAGAQLEAANMDGNTALWLACVGANLETIDVLIRAGVNLNHQNESGATCLMYAASTSKHAVVEKLLQAGANPRLKSQDDFTALDMAASIECLRLLRAQPGSAATLATTGAR
jgi:thiosulfate/3-mercaptopyruvate sulfurtransferase